ncbi:MAG: family 16 glycoside hydrolase [Opitutaceae bacterium]
MTTPSSRRTGCIFSSRIIWLVGLALAAGAVASAGDDLPKTLMTERGKIIYSEDFLRPLETSQDAAKSRGMKWWRPAIGRWNFTTNGLEGAQIKGEHSAINILHLPFQDAVIQFDAQVNGCNRCIFRINDFQAGRPRTSEHLCRVTLTKEGLVSQKDDHDHEGPDTAVRFGEIKRPFTPGQWKTVLIEIRGDEMVVTMDGQTVVGRHPLLATPKDNIGFGVTGASALFRNLKIWEARPNKDWAGNKEALGGALNRSSPPPTK